MKVKPRSEAKIVINGPNGDITEEQEVADVFNTFFVKKIADLKESIDPNLTSDPLERIRQKMKNKLQ